ncbi:MAG: sugar transferase [Gemmatimonadaceae bacterium]
MTVTLKLSELAPAEPTPRWPRRELQSAARTNRRLHARRHLARLVRLYLLDAAAVGLALFAMLVIDPANGWETVVRWNDPAASALSVLAQHVIVIFGGLFLMKAYEEGDAVADVGRLVPGVALGLLVLYWSMLWHDSHTFFSSYLPTVGLFAATVWVERMLSDRSFRVASWPSVLEPARGLFVGRVQDIESAIRRGPLKGRHAVASVAQLDVSRAMRGVSHRLGSLDELLQATIHDHDVDTIVLCSQFSDAELLHIVETSEAAGCRVISMSRAFGVAKRGPTIRSYGRTPIVELTQPGIRGRDVVLKRAFDLVAAAILLVIASPLMLVIALLVKRSSPGPVLFRQERVGYGGGLFRIFKFRTMCLDAEDHVDALRHESVYGDERLFKLVRDPRVTRLGRFLRRSSLDELPQLLNVLAGSMSLVGPRPPLPREVAMYGDSSFLRFDVKPGITGPWQVNGRNSITSFDEVIALEAAYVTGWTIWRDFVILARTIPAVLRMEGAH